MIKFTEWLLKFAFLAVGLVKMFEGQSFRLQDNILPLWFPTGSVFVPISHIGGAKQVLLAASPKHSVFWTNYRTFCKGQPMYFSSTHFFSINPLTPRKTLVSLFTEISILFNLRRDHQKNFLWASRLWVGRRKEPILGYVPKNDENRISSIKG